MMIGGVLACMTNLMFVWLASVGHNSLVMYLAVIMDNLASGLAGAVFIAFLSSLTSIRFTARAICDFSSLMTLIPKVLGGYSGTIVDNMGYAWFFTFTTLLGLPILALIYWVDKTVMAKPNDTAVVK
ncbi:muropeptide transporter [Moraxella atlantae]|uniref:Muropeptide transporter n=1 Tax=Faucicola atlantae TaxID=34059 RepID=A0A378QL86_9GAMM|nr:muropeptide transporter [Moraxella atlantae]